MSHRCRFVIWVGLRVCVAYSLCTGLTDTIAFVSSLASFYCYIFSFVFLGASFLYMVYFIQLVDFYSLILKCCFCIVLFWQIEFCGIFVAREYAFFHLISLPSLSAAMLTSIHIHLGLDTCLCEYLCIS